MRAYENLGDWLLGVRAERVTKRHDRRVRAAAPSTGANEGSGADGGYAVPPELADQIISAVSAISIVGRCKQLPARTNAPVIPLDHEAPWLASNCFWDQEMVAMDQSKPVFAQASFRLNKVTCLIPISSETLEDTNFFDGWARNAIPKKIAAKLTRAIVRGTGAGQLAGILGHPSTIAVTRGMSVTATAATMWRRLYGGGRANAVWLVGESVDVPTAAGQPLAMHGAPVVSLESCSAAGTKGDIILADLSQFLIVAKALQVAQSAHGFFDSDSQAYRFVLRVAGQPLWNAPKQPENGTDTVSAFVVAESA